MLSTRAMLLFTLRSATAFATAEGELRLAVESGVDSNVRRDYARTGTVADGELSVSGSASGRLKSGRWSAWADYEAGLRAFPNYTEETAVVQAATGEVAARLAGPVGLGVGTHDKDRRGGNRDYSDLEGDAFLAYAADSAMSARVHAGAHRYVYWDNFAYSFSAPEVGLTGRYDFTARHAALFFADVGLRTYNSGRNAPPQQPPPDGRRTDTALSVGATYAYKGPFALRLTYAYFEQDSNSFGESWSRHRFSVTAGLRLPARFFLLVDVAVQFAQYPDGVLLSADTLLAQDQENGNALSIKVARPVAAHLDLEAHYGVYYNHLPANGLVYWRQLGWVGLSVRL